MQKSKFVWYFLVTLVVGILLVVFNTHVIWSTSVDLAHHYALVFRFFESWHLVPNDPSLAEMNIYPPGSHMAAAMVGKAVGSPFLGMHLVALGSLVLLWVACLSILYAAPNRIGPLSAVALALLLVINHGALRVHGAEISGAYHYAQLVGQALAFAVLAIALRTDARLHRTAAYIVLLLAMPVVATVHLLPALELLGVLAGLLLLDVVAAQDNERVRKILVGAALLAIGVAAVVLHPSFAAMRAISAHNGGVSLGLLGPMWSLALVSLIVVASVVPLLRAWNRDRAGNVMYKYLAVYGLTIAGLCLLQMALRYVNLGSDYAVKKYAYVLATFLVLRLAMWIGASATARAERNPRVASLFKRTPIQVGMFGFALALAVLGCARMRQDVDTFKVMDFERQLLSLRENGSLPVPGKPVLVADLEGMHVVINYMFSLAVTHTPRDIVLPYFTTGMDPGPLAQYGLIATSREHSRFSAAVSCAKASSASLLVLDAACVEQSGGAQPAAASR